MQKQSRYYISFFKLDSKAARFKKGVSSLLNRANFTRGELALWFSSLFIITAGFFLLGGGGPLILPASLVGVSSLIFSAKGNPVGPLLMVLFSCMYGAISYRFQYYGEMATYLGMTAPMSLLALASWLRNPYQGRRSQVKVGRMGKRDVIRMTVAAIGVTAAFWYILKALGTANLLPSTLSVTTSFLAVYMTYRRSEYYALAYGANDIVLVALWVMAALEEQKYWPVAICFGVFLVNDLYGFISWQRMRKSQEG